MIKIKNRISYDKDIVRVFGLENIEYCTKEENEIFFDKDIDLELHLNLIKSIKENDIIDYIDKILEHIKKNKTIYIRLTFLVASTLLLISNPTNIYAYSYVAQDNILRNVAENVGSDIFDGVSMGTIKGTLIITALRLFAEYTRGGSKYKSFEIIKQCVVVLSVIIILPLLPGIVTLLVKKYLPY